PDDDDDAVYFRNIIGFSLRSPFRRPILSLFVFVTALALTIAAVIYLPRTYETALKVLVQRNLVLPTLGNPRRAVPIDHDSPTKGIPEAILARENLVSLVRQLSLLDRWEAQRPPLLKVADRIFGMFGVQRSEEDKLHSLLDFLEKRLRVSNDDTTFTVTVEWP